MSEGRTTDRTGLRDGESDSGLGHGALGTGDGECGTISDCGCGLVVKTQNVVLAEEVNTRKAR